MITQLSSQEKLTVIQKVIDAVTKKETDPWANSIYAPFKSKGSNYDIGDFGDIYARLNTHQGEHCNQYFHTLMGILINHF